LDRPDKVRAALAGDLADDDLEAELRPLGWGGGVPWDGEVVRLNIASPPPNPFVAGPPLKGVDRLPGREAVIADLIAGLDNPRSPSLGGPRGVGKPPALHALARRLGPGRDVHWASLEGDYVRTEDDLAVRVMPRLRGDSHPAESLRDLLRGEKRPVLLL